MDLLLSMVADAFAFYLTSMHSLFKFLGALTSSSMLSSCCQPFETLLSRPPSVRIEMMSNEYLNSLK